MLAMGRTARGAAITEERKHRQPWWHELFSSGIEAFKILQALLPLVRRSVIWIYSVTRTLFQQIDSTKFADPVKLPTTWTVVSRYPVSCRYRVLLLPSSSLRSVATAAKLPYIAQERKSSIPTQTGRHFPAFGIAPSCKCLRRGLAHSTAGSFSFRFSVLNDGPNGTNNMRRS